MPTGRRLTGPIRCAHDSRFRFPTFAETKQCSGAASVEPVIAQDDAPTSMTRGPQNPEAEG